MYHIERYKRNPVVDYPEREWPNKQIEKAPSWCSVDLRDGNQALVEPMVVEEKMEMFSLLLKLGFKEIEIGFPAASQIEFDFLRQLSYRRMIPDDVHVQILSQCRDHLIPLHLFLNHMHPVNPDNPPLNLRKHLTQRIHPGVHRTILIIPKSPENHKLLPIHNRKYNRME